MNDASALQSGGGDVYVVDRGDDRVERFGASGGYLGQFDGSGSFEVEGKVESGLAAPSGRLSSPDEIAVDDSTNPLDPSAGDVYVQDPGHKVVDKFTPTGEYISQLTEASAGQSFGELEGVATDPSGNLWIYERANPQVVGNLVEFDDTGAFVKAFSPERGVGSGIAADGNGNVYVITGAPTPVRFEASTGKQAAEFDEGKVTALAIQPTSNDVLVDEGSGIARYEASVVEGTKPIEAFPEGGGLSESHGVAAGSGSAYATEVGADAVEVFDFVPLPGVVTGQPSEVSETSATLHGEVDPEGEALTSCSFEYGTSTSYGASVPCEQSPSAIGAGGAYVEVTAKVSGLAPALARHVRLAAANAHGTKHGADITLERPLIEQESAAGAGTNEASVSARINAHGLLASYRVEYGADAGYGSITPVETLGAPNGPVNTSVRLTGLRPGTEYHFRFVATNSLGETTGEDETFTSSGSSGGSALELPDERVYELVSPPRRREKSISRRRISSRGKTSVRKCHSAHPHRAQASRMQPMRPQPEVRATLETGRAINT